LAAVGSWPPPAPLRGGGTAKMANKLLLESAFTPTNWPTEKVASATGCPWFIALTPAPIVYECDLPFLVMSVKFVALIAAILPMVGLFLGPAVLLF
jgi:hypothetical protein